MSQEQNAAALSQARNAQRNSEATSQKVIGDIAKCDNPIRDNSVLSPKPLHLVIKR
jgi:hypothetical protein